MSELERNRTSAEYLEDLFVQIGFSTDAELTQIFDAVCSLITAREEDRERKARL